MTRPTTRFDAVLFDWDDTLCGSEPHRYAFAQEVARHFGVDMPLVEVYRAFIRAGDARSFPGPSFMWRVAAELGIDPDIQASFIHAFQQREVYRRFALYDDVLDMIDDLGHRRLRVGVISNNDGVARFIRMMDVEHRFEIIVGPSTYSVEKPHPEIFLRACEDMGVAPQRTVYVGDSYDNDVVGARAVGMTPVLVDRFGINLDGHDAEHRVETLETLGELLDTLLV